MSDKSLGKPLLYGDQTFDVDRLEELEQIGSAGWDASYVPGYSEKRRENELRARKGLKPLPLPRMQWIRAATVDGRNVPTSEMYNWARLGYRKVSEEDFADLGIEMPPSAHKAPDGSIAREDLILAFVPDDVAAFNRRKQEQTNAEFTGQNIANVEVYERESGRGIPSKYIKDND